MMAAGGAPPTPPAFTKVDYVYNPLGTGYIDTGYKAGNNTDIEVSFIPNNNNYLWGGRISATSKTFGFYAQDLSDQHKAPRFDYGNNFYHYSTELKLNTFWDFANNANIGDITIEGTTYTITATAATFECTQNLYIFGVNNNGTPVPYNNAKYAYFYIKENGVYIKKLEAYQRIADGEYGFLDTVNDVFYTPSNGVSLAGGMFADLLLNYPGFGSGNGITDTFRRDRATLLQKRSATNQITWSGSTPSIISDNYTLPHKGGNRMQITLNQSAYYVAFDVVVRNGSTYSTPYSAGWSQSVDADLSSYTGDEVWLNIKFKFNAAGTAQALLQDADYTIQWD